MCCIDPVKDDEEKHKGDEVKEDDQESSYLGQPTDIEEIKPPEVTQDKEKIFQFQPFEGMHFRITNNSIHAEE